MRKHASYPILVCVVNQQKKAFLSSNHFVEAAMRAYPFSAALEHGNKYRPVVVLCAVQILHLSNRLNIVESISE
jgi:hypothetical protein